MSTEYETIRVTPVTPTIGAEIAGVDLREPLGNQTFQEIHDALMRHQVIFFRDQDLDLDQHKRFGRLFGELHIHPNEPGPEGHPEILRIHADENSKRVAGENWHSDVSCDAEPPLGSILRLHTIPSSGGDTLFASMYAAYDALSDKMKEILAGLTAVHDGRPQYRKTNDLLGREDEKEFPRSEHPVVRTHPVTGRKALFVNSVFTQGIVGMKRSESRALLDFLYEHVEQSRFQCRFRWEKDSIAFWDNRCVQHLAMWDYFPEVRSGYRVTVKGDRPF